MKEEMKVETKTQPSSAPIPLSEFRAEKQKRFTLRKIIIGFVMAASFVAAMNGSLTSISFVGLALWMAQAKSE